MHAVYNVNELGGAINQLSSTSEAAMKTASKHTSSIETTSTRSKSTRDAWVAGSTESKTVAAVQAAQPVKIYFGAHEDKRPAEKKSEWKNEEHYKGQGPKVSTEAIDAARSYSQKVIETQYEQLRKQQDALTNIVNTRTASTSTASSGESQTSTTLTATRPIYQASTRPIYQASTRPIYQASTRPIYQASTRPIYTSTSTTGSSASAETKSAPAADAVTEVAK